ncbi:MAG: translation initiation factor IF-2 [Anaerosomatales bacterium]|nr:translation initiation factor IF-2 [Anaerosomatales bacterium]MDT8433379.1 translation initiation factor IF-2 [Anaerosomatales bacterium]
MPSMRVHELAKEFGMTSKELLEQLQAMKIPAKNHASTLVEAYVDKIRKDLGPLIAERQAALEEERLKVEAAEAAKREAEEAARKAEDDARRAVEAAERARREEAARITEEARRAAEAKEAAEREAEEAARKAEEERHAAEAAEAAERARREAEESPTLEKSEEDRYRQMAKQAEVVSRSTIIEEAKQAVAAAGAEQGKRKKRKEKRQKHAEEVAAETAQTAPAAVASGDTELVSVTEGVTVGEFAEALGVPSTEIIKRLMLLGTPLTVNQPMMSDIVELIADDMGREVVVVSPEEETGFVFDDAPEDLKPRPPVVTVMGHVDHGKTSLLDAIRETGVAETEAGGITQHIGASVVLHDDKQITFIDTPGHEAFTAMRARGAKVTDVAVLVVAADDGVMPQTVEAIHHAKAAGVPIIVAVNKIDKDGANPDRVRQELTEHEIVPEAWGGTDIFVDVSAKQRLNIHELLEMILLQADVLELKANPDATASGIVIEAKLDKGRGPVATVLVQRGTLHVGDSIVAGTTHGRVRALVNPLGEPVTSAGPADPVEILGLGSVPSAGDEFRIFADERDARNLAEERALKQRLLAQEKKVHVSLDDLFARIQEGELKDLNLVVKADVQGSIGALKDALDKMDQTEVRINVIHSAVGAITETDVMLADASDAIIIGFNVRPEPKARSLAEKESVDIRLYRVIYQAIEDINAARVGMLAPEFHEEDTARVEIRELFRVPKMGVIAGCYVQEGEISRDDKVRLVRQGTVIYEGKLGSLRRFKDDVKSVRQGYECGLSIDGFQDIKEGDVVEGFKTVEVARES